MDRVRIPPRGQSVEDLLAALSKFREGDADWRGGRTFSLVYDAGPEHHALLERASALFLSENALNPLAFASLRRLETELVQMSASLFHGPETTVGTLTTGGTESLLLAVKTYRDRARRRRPWILRPEMVAPETIHVGFDKAAALFDVRLRRVPVKEDGRADVAAMKAKIGPRTILVAASAPQYPHGVMDPVPEVGALAQRRKLPFHVDACFGGFFLPWMERMGRVLPPWDFRVPGVTSVSADLHKFGYGAKGASVLLYRNMQYLRHQFFVATEWPGGIYASATLPGTKSGGPMAAAWASLMHLGEEGLLELTRRTLDAKERLQDGVESIVGLAVVGQPEGPALAWRSVDPAVETYAVADGLAARGWHVDRQHRPACVHCTLSANNLDAVESYLQDLAEVVAEVRANPGAARSGEAPMYGLMAELPARGLVRQGVLEVMEKMYAAQPKAPDLAEGQPPLVDAILKYGQPALRWLGQLRERRRRR